MFPHKLNLGFILLLLSLMSCQAFKDIFNNSRIESQQSLQTSPETTAELKALTPLGQTFFHMDNAGSQVFFHKDNASSQIKKIGILFTILETPLSKTSLMYVVNMDSLKIFPVLKSTGKQLNLKPILKEGKSFVPVYVSYATPSVIKFDYRNENNRCTPYLASVAEDQLFIAGSFQDYDCKDKF